MRKFIPVSVDIDVKDSAKYYCDIFKATALAIYEKPEAQVSDLLIVLDDLEGLSEKYDQDFESRKAVREGLKTCWQNLPEDPNVKMAIRPRIMISAAQFDAILPKLDR
jgi:hypothetical protein